MFKPEDILKEMAESPAPAIAVFYDDTRMAYPYEAVWNKVHKLIPDSTESGFDPYGGPGIRTAGEYLFYFGLKKPELGLVFRGKRVTVIESGKIDELTAFLKVNNQNENAWKLACEFLKKNCL